MQVKVKGISNFNYICRWDEKCRNTVYA